MIELSFDNDYTKFSLNIALSVWTSICFVRFCLIILPLNTILIIPNIVQPWYSQCGDHLIVLWVLSNLALEACALLYTLEIAMPYCNYRVRCSLPTSCLFQPPVNYGSLTVTGIYRSLAGDTVEGMCYLRGRLYTVEGRRMGGSFRYTLAVYGIDRNSLTLLDTLDLGGTAAWVPRVDRHTGHIYVPCMSLGVCVVRFDGRKLVTMTTLKCVQDPRGLGIISSGLLYICDWERGNDCLVDVTQDRVTSTIQAPQGVIRGSKPCHRAVLGDTVLVGYTGPSLVLYRHGFPASSKMVPWPKQLQSLYGLTTDNHSSFLLADSFSHSVFVLDASGNLTHTIPIPEYKRPQDCVVVAGQLLVGCDDGDIIVMSSK